MRPESLKLLEDMRQATEELASFTSGKTLDDYLADPLLRRGTERCFEIVGEALSRLRKVDPATAESFSEWRSIISFRNVLIHGYAAIDHRKTWDIVESDLPVLREELQERIASG
jgi:uncharacterized protein with HEPN domain